MIELKYCITGLLVLFILSIPVVVGFWIAYKFEQIDKKRGSENLYERSKF